jgi:Cys-rich repeat protein
MTWKFLSALTLGAVLLAGTPAQAVSCKRDADCPTGQVCSAGTCTSRRSGAARAADAVAPTEAIAGTKRTPHFGWGGLGLYNVPGSTYFGIHAGAAANLFQINPDLPLVGWADVALTFGSDLFFPIAAGAGVRYDRAGPFQLLGGAGFALLPHTGAGPTPVGLRLMGMVLYPLPQLNRNLSAQAQISYDILTESSHLFTLTAGLGYAL